MLTQEGKKMEENHSTQIKLKKTIYARGFLKEFANDEYVCESVIPTIQHHEPVLFQFGLASCTHE